MNSNILRCISGRLLNNLSRRHFTTLNCTRSCSIVTKYDRHKSYDEQYNGPKTNKVSRFVIAGSLLAWITGKKNQDGEDPEEQLVMTIKRSILSIQKEEYNKAEQMLHVALKMAQDLGSKDGITYIYDVMANLALQVGDFKKAEKLFANVMQRLFAEGFLEDHIKMLHISSKLAHMAQLQGHVDKAVQGFQWTLERIENNLKKVAQDEELLELWGLTKNWYGQVLMEVLKFEEAKECFQQAYEVYTKIHGKLTEEGLMILNNLSVACSNLEDYVSAEKYLKEAISLAAEIPDLSEAGVYQANLGLLYLHQGILEQAKSFCSTAWHYGKRNNNLETVAQADFCLDQIKKATEKQTKK